MGCIGVIYSLVLEVTPLTGMREVVTQTTWWNQLALVTGAPTTGPVFPAGIAAEAQLRFPSSNVGLSAAIVKVLTDGSTTSMVPTAAIPMGQNVYADLAFNPNRRADGDLAHSHRSAASHISRCAGRDWRGRQFHGGRIWR